MRAYFYHSLSLTFVLLMAGCASGSKTYFPSTRSPFVKTTLDVHLSKEKVWAKLVAGLSSSFFVVNNIDKLSGFINLSYSGDPEQYVDGGELLFTMSNLRGKREYRFPASRARASYEATINDNLCGIVRQLDLEGRINVLVSEIDSTSTRVAVNCKYVLTLKATGQDVMGNQLAPYQETISFNSGQTAALTAGTEFRSTGKLEQSILEIIGPVQ